MWIWTEEDEVEFNQASFLISSKLHETLSQKILSDSESKKKLKMICIIIKMKNEKIYYFNGI